MLIQKVLLEFLAALFAPGRQVLYGDFSGGMAGKCKDEVEGSKTLKSFSLTLIPG